MKSQITTKSEKETTEFAEKSLREALRGAERDKPLIFWLEGELGAGKTQFVKGLAAGLDIKDRITSPTFVLMKKFKIPKTNPAAKKGKSLFFHIDCYRIYDSEDAKQIGLDEVIKNPRAIVAIEWAERIVDIIFAPYWKLNFEHVEESNRKISIKNVSR